MYQNMTDCLLDLERNNHLIRITEPVSGYLEMAAIHRRVFEVGGPALWFVNVQETPFTAASNIFGTLERSRFIFRKTLDNVKTMIGLKQNPLQAIKNPLRYAKMPFSALSALPKRSTTSPVLTHETTLSKLPQIQCWPADGGPFVTLPLVYSEDPDNPTIMTANLGMYRIQIAGNNYIPDKEAGIHYQIHRGIGVHQTKANKKGQPLKVSIFIGGPPAHILAAVMPLPEGMSEMLFAGALAGKRFSYSYHDGYCISNDADFVITGEVWPHENKPEGPFGDHLGYYSLKHDFPLLRIHKIWHKPNPVWSFTVVGRPPQEDTAFGALIHELTGDAIPAEIPGLKEVHAVDAAGVHPLLLAVGSERYTPYYKEKKPQEILTIANRILGTGQLSLAKYLFIAAQEEEKINLHKPIEFFQYLLKRIHFDRDLHFYTKTSIDTLDYSGEGLNSGSKVVFACAGDPIRTLATEIPSNLPLPQGLSNPKMIMPGIMALQTENYQIEAATNRLLNALNESWKDIKDTLLAQWPLIIWCDDSNFTSHNEKNFLWVTFTRSNPSHDIHGIASFIQHKHWGCRGSLIIDARIKPHHAPPLIEDPIIEQRIDALATRGKSLYGIL